jgi:copper chaperone CopZ
MESKGETMIQTTLQIDGMACSMCESHINDAIRNNFNVKKVASSHNKGETVIQSSDPLDEEKLKSVIQSTGYTLRSIASAPFEKKRFSLFRTNN